jgi:GNAT superfamily N-acetyltransferase
MTSLSYDVTFDPSADAVEAIERGLHAFNVAHLGEDVIYNYHRIAAVARDAGGHIVGGVHGELCWDWLHVKTMWVAEGHRGQGVGTHLLTALEEAALNKGFSMAHLETTGFQALGFYLKNGYQIFGRLPGKPAGHAWYFMRKDLGEKGG